MTVVAGVHEAPISAEIVAKAMEQARWRGTDLHLVYVTHLPMVYTEVAINWDEVANAQRTAVWAGLDQTIGESDVAVEKIDVEGYPPDTLVTYANDVGASLLVVGTRGRGDFASLMLGSTSHRAIHLAECDVLVVKGTPEEE